MRTTQQDACYAAEGVLGDGGTSFADVAAAQRWVDDLRDTHWWQLMGYSLRVLRIEVHAAPKNFKFAASTSWQPEMSAGAIAVAPHGLTAATMLHEVAHVLADAAHESTAHDPAWARTYLTLVSCVLGPDAYLTLQRAFDDHGVVHDVPVRSPSAFAL